MIRQNIYKPRYKIAFQAKNKIWPYKNSRLRRFFNIRGRKLVRGGYFKRYVLVFNNMKWTIARRYFRPYMRRRRPIRFKYRDAFYRKQQLRNFYGRVKETKFRNLYKNFIGKTMNRNVSFFSDLERRLDVVLFRLRILPTIFAANQFIHHHGILLNDKLKKIPGRLVNIKDVISFPKKSWKPIFRHLIRLIYHRAYGNFILKRRQYKLLKKKIWWILRAKKVKKRYKKFYFKILNKKKQFNLLFLKINKNFNKEINKSIYFLILKKENNLFINNISENYISKFLMLKKKMRKLLQIYFLYNKTFFFKKYRFLFARKTKYNLNIQDYNKYLYKLISFFYFSYKSLNYLLFTFKMEKYNLYLEIFNLIKTKNLNENNFDLQKFQQIFHEKKSFFLYNYLILIKKINTFFKLFLRNNIKKISINTRSNKNSLLFFWVNRGRKKDRRLLVPRLKKTHWYLPSNIYFEYNTLSAFIMHNPSLSSNLFYPFKSSWSKIYSFYKSRGY